MSSLYKVKRDNSYRIDFMFNEKRWSIRLGKINKQTANAVQSHIDSLVSADEYGQEPPAETKKWLSEIGKKLHAKLSRTGICESRVTVNLEEFIEDYIVRRQANKATKAKMRAIKNHLIDYFGDKPIPDITEDDAAAWAKSLVGGRSTSTVGRATGIAHQFMLSAVKKGIITQSPFQSLPKRVYSNRDRMHYVPQEVGLLMIQAAPEPEWAGLIALARFAGLRCPSEILELKWEHVDFEDKNIVIQNVKTRHNSKPYRVFPMNDVIEGVLRTIPQVAELVLPRLCAMNSPTQTWTKFVKHHILYESSLDDWPKLFQNMRASCATDLLKQGVSFKAYSEWMGHSMQEAQEHYLMVTEQDKKKALKLNG